LTLCRKSDGSVRHVGIVIEDSLATEAARQHEDKYGLIQMEAFRGLLRLGAA